MGGGAEGLVWVDKSGRGVGISGVKEWGCGRKGGEVGCWGGRRQDTGVSVCGWEMTGYRGRKKGLSKAGYGDRIMGVVGDRLRRWDNGGCRVQGTVVGSWMPLCIAWCGASKRLLSACQVRSILWPPETTPLAARFGVICFWSCRCVFLLVSHLLRSLHISCFSSAYLFI